jgi:tetratricopeptide (TPR) repeat protein
MGKIIPYQNRRFKPLDFVRVDEKTIPNGQMNLFDSPRYPEATLLPISDNAFDLALKLDLKNDPGAERFYLRAIEKNENIAHAYCNLGVLAAHKENMIEAVDYFTRALAEDPRHVETHFNLANVYFAVGNHHLALFHYRLVNRIAPDFADGYFNLGLTLLETEDLKNAQHAFLQYQRLSPDLKSDQVATILKSLASLI